jgi:hypothetical protein
VRERADAEERLRRPDQRRRWANHPRLSTALDQARARELWEKATVTAVLWSEQGDLPLKAIHRPVHVGYAQLVREATDQVTGRESICGVDDQVNVRERVCQLTLTRRPR